MLTMKRMGLAMAAALVVIVATAPTARALTRSDRPAGIVVYPRIDVDTANQVDTVIQLTNLNATTSVTAKCFYVNANSHCSNTGEVCQDAGTCGGLGACVAGWAVTDFNIVLTPRQPLGWRASQGLGTTGNPLPLGNVHVCQGDPSTDGTPCFNSFVCGLGSCVPGPSNNGTLIPPTAEDPFRGELRCIEVSTSDEQALAGANDLTGEATIETVTGAEVIDVATYNAIGIQSTLPAAGAASTAQTLILGPGEAYAACPSTLVINHLFDSATDPISVDDTATTELTLVPCSVDLTGSDPTLATSTAQFLVYNEFEQRFSTSLPIDCFFEGQLSLIDTTQPERSIWSAAVAGTVAGQTRVRGVGRSGLLGVARLLISGNGTFGSSAYNIHQSGGDRDTLDTIVMP